MHSLYSLLSNKKVILVAYLLLIFLATPSSLYWLVKITFLIFALYLFWILEYQQTTRSELPITNYHLLIPIIILLTSRMIPFLRWPSVNPLGADAFVYLERFGTNWNPYFFVFGSYILFSIFTAITIFLITNQLHGKTAAFFSLLLFAISPSQFLVYFAFYWKMIWAMGLTLTTFYLLNKKSWWSILVGGLMGGWYLLSFLPFGLTMIGHYLFNKDNRKFILITGLGIIIITTILAWDDLAQWLPYYTKNLGIIDVNYNGELAYEFEGHFIDFDLYKKLALPYLPFALLGLIYFLKRKQLDLLFFYFLANFILVYFNFIYHNRFIVLLDLAMIILSGKSIADLFHYSKPITILILVCLVVLTFYLAWFIEPLETLKVIHN